MIKFPLMFKDMHLQTLTSHRGCDTLIPRMRDSRGGMCLRTGEKKFPLPSADWHARWCVCWCPTLCACQQWAAGDSMWGSPQSPTHDCQHQTQDHGDLWVCVGPLAQPSDQLCCLLSVTAGRVLCDSSSGTNLMETADLNIVKFAFLNKCRLSSHTGTN